ncbi:MAG: hypothetical protein QNJ88_06780 [Acidimicrobiia bacterium]|nr:hypothetical protein [Acidimicrobiia bacterium]
MRRLVILVAVLALLVASCGGDDGGVSDDASGGDASGNDSVQSDGGDGAPGGDVVNVQAAGEAFVSVDGQEFTLTGSPSLDCDIGPEAITFAFWVGDNSTTLGGGANLYDDGWLGSIRLATVDDEGLPVAYYPDDGAMDGGVAISGDSMSFSGPMLMQPPNDGTNPPPVQVGDGTISVTCG